MTSGEVICFTVANGQKRVVGLAAIDRTGAAIPKRTTVDMSRKIRRLAGYRLQRFVSVGLDAGQRTEQPNRLRMLGSGEQGFDI